MQPIVANRTNVVILAAITTLQQDVVEYRDQLDVRLFQVQMVRDVVLDISVLISIQRTRKRYAEKLSTRNNGPFTHRHFDSNFFCRFAFIVYISFFI
jgi:hypothetical protein